MNHVQAGQGIAEQAKWCDISWKGWRLVLISLQWSRAPLPLLLSAAIIFWQDETFSIMAFHMPCDSRPTSLLRRYLLNFLISHLLNLLVNAALLRARIQEGCVSLQSSRGFKGRGWLRWAFGGLGVRGRSGRVGRFWRRITRDGVRYYAFGQFDHGGGTHQTLIRFPGGCAGPGLIIQMDSFSMYEEHLSN